MLDPRTRVPPSRGFDKRLFGYALAAGAGLLAAGQPANAGIVYIDPADVTYTNTSFNLDLNSDGVTDVHFANYGVGYSWTSKSGQQMRSTERYAFWQAAGAVPSPVPAGTPIGPGMSYTTGLVRIVYARSFQSGSKWNRSASANYGPFLNGGDEFFGLQFTDLSANTLYGWVRLSGYGDINTNTIAITIKDWAYEDAGNPINAGQTESGVPEPGTLGLLAFGAAGLAMLRAGRKKRA